MISLESFIKDAISAYDMPTDSVTYREIKGMLSRAGYSNGVPDGSAGLVLDLILSQTKPNDTRMAKVASAVMSNAQHCPRCNGVMTNVNLYQGSAIHCPSCNVVVPH